MSNVRALRVLFATGFDGVRRRFKVERRRRLVVINGENLAARLRFKRVDPVVYLSERVCCCSGGGVFFAFPERVRPISPFSPSFWLATRHFPGRASGSHTSVHLVFFWEINSRRRLCTISFRHCLLTSDGERYLQP